MSDAQEDVTNGTMPSMNFLPCMACSHADHVLCESGSGHPFCECWRRKHDPNGPSVRTLKDATR